jgi:hypothetical protein
MKILFNEFYRRKNSMALLSIAISGLERKTAKSSQNLCIQISTQNKKMKVQLNEFHRKNPSARFVL